MTIEEMIQKDPGEFQEALETRVPEIRGTLNELSSRLDVIIGGVIREYAEKSGAEMEINHIASYKTLNRIITRKLDTVIGEHIRDKRRDL